MNPKSSTADIDIAVQKYLSAVSGHIDGADPESDDALRAGLRKLIARKDFRAQKLAAAVRRYTNCDDSHSFVEYAYEYVLSLSFPKSINTELSDEKNREVRIFLEFYRQWLKLEKETGSDEFYIKNPIELLTEQEASALEKNHEYHRFIKHYEEEYIYEMMKLNQEIKGYSTLDHISGVSNVAAYTARQLREAGLPVDVATVIAAAAGHDIGKFGCRKNEEKRVPYLHYYYTDIWFRERNMPYIANVAANHSTWDLELENLPAECLVLIYSDFRVKNRNGSMYIYPLSESFQVILDKLDNVDEAKERRYRKVYAKLRDFENFMIENCIDTTLTNEGFEQAQRNKQVARPDLSLAYGSRIAESFKYKAIEYNINILNRFSAAKSFNEMLVDLSGEKNWKKLREYLSTFEEYYIYTSQLQKTFIMNMLKELLLYKEEDVRNQAAKIIGLLIANFDQEYRKEIPQDVTYDIQEIKAISLFEKYIEYFIYKDHKLTEKQKRWLEINTRNFVSSIFENGSDKTQEYYDVLEKIYRKAMEPGSSLTQPAMAMLSQLIKYIPVKKLKTPHTLVSFMKQMYSSESADINMSITKSIHVVLRNLDRKSECYQDLADFVIKNTQKSGNKTVDFIKYRLVSYICEKSGISAKKTCHIFEADEMTKEEISDIYLRNLKSATSWIEKKSNIDLLVDLTLTGRTTNNLQTVMHFCNLLKVSSAESVRNHSGKAILSIFHLLERQEKNEACIELIRALEMQDLQFTKYIPEYIGKIMIYQEPGEFDEILEDFYYKVKTASVQVAWLILVAAGYAIESYISNGYELDADPARYSRRLEKMVGILLVGLYSFDRYLSHEALKIIAGNIFSSKNLTLGQKYKVYRLVDKKILNMLKNRNERRDLYIRNAASLNSIYRFISDYEFLYGEMKRGNERSIAFFPGTFDPFSLGHKEIARAIRDMGYDVFLAVDEFSWSKKTQPNNIRRNIIKVSVAEEPNIYLLPEDVQVNLSNEENLRNLSSIFEPKKVSIVVGSDVILNASSYSSDENQEILKYDHIIFHRRNSGGLSEEEELLLLSKKTEMIKGNVEILSLPPQYEDISSTQIRDSIDEEQDISELIDPLAQKFIYRYALYRKEPMFKRYFSNMTLRTEVIDDCSQQKIKTLIESCVDPDVMSDEQISDIAAMLSGYENLRAVVIRDEKNDDVLGFTTSSWLRSTQYYSEFRDKKISDYVRQNSLGRISYINGMCINESASINNIYQILLTETLAIALEKDYTYCIFKNFIPVNQQECRKIFELQGFEYIEGADIQNTVQCVNMAKPIVLNLDLRSMLKEPFRSNSRIKKEIYRTRENLQRALARLYRGELVLSFDRSVTYGKLIKKVCDINEVGYDIKVPRQLGKNMCVPYGATLNGALVPNTVTKSLHTEKTFTPSLMDFDFRKFPNYMDIRNQIKVLSSFRKPVILIDDILHKGHRIKALDPLFREADIEIKQIVVAILSGQGKELMDIQERDVEYIYFLPNLKNWFNENSLYPFMGGDYVYREGSSDEYILPSINFILPYASPGFVRNTDPENIYTLSETCIKNAIRIFETIESEYQHINESSFNLKKIGEVFQKPRKPDQGKCIDYDLDLKPSEYLRNDLEKLKRLKNIIYR